MSQADVFKVFAKLSYKKYRTVFHKLLDCNAPHTKPFNEAFMTRKLTLTVMFMLCFLSLGIIADSITSDSIFISKALAGNDSGGAGHGT